MATILAPAPRRTARQNRQYLRRGAFYFVCTALAAIFLAPLIWAMLTSIKPGAETTAVPPTLLPSRIAFENYTNLNRVGSGIVRHVGNSVLVSAYTIVGTVLLSTLAGYGFARFDFWGKQALFILALAPLMIPFQAVMIPLFLVLRALNLNNTLLGLAFVYITTQLPFGIFVMRNAFAVVPREIEEAALLDGCSSLGMLRRVMLPLVLPGGVTIAMFAFFSAWNEFFAALIYLADMEKFTLPLLLATARNNPGLFGGTNWGGLQAGVTVTILPCLFVFIVLQRYYIRGLLGGAVKS